MRSGHEGTGRKNMRSVGREVRRSYALLTMDVDNRMKLFLESSRALQRYLFDRSVSFLDMGSVEKTVSSGTLVRAGERLFVATAGHVIPEAADKRLWILSSTERSEREPWLQILRWGRNEDSGPDVGYLEVGRNAESMTGHKAIDIGRIDRQGRQPDGRPVTLLGSPADQANVQRPNDSVLEVAARAVAFSTTPIRVANWPQVPESATMPQHDIDVFLDYPERGLLNIDSGNEMEVKSPAGMSGGGIWDHGWVPGEVWSPESSRLVAIQSSWLESKRYLRGVLAAHWCVLLARDYPELATVAAPDHR